MYTHIHIYTAIDEDKVWHKNQYIVAIITAFTNIET
jgi:hypothetical protein